MPRRHVSPPALLLAILLLMPRPAAAQTDVVRGELVNGVARVVLVGSWAGARYTVTRADAPTAPFVTLGERDALCTGDCYALDPEALLGGTYWYRFDVTGADGIARTHGPTPVTIGGTAAQGLSARPSPNPLRERGTLRVTAALPVGARTDRPGAATDLPGELLLLDTSGRVRRTLWRGTLDRLVFDVAFEARDDRGVALPAGLYLAVLRAGEHRSVSRVVVVR